MGIPTQFTTLAPSYQAINKEEKKKIHDSIKGQLSTFTIIIIQNNTTLPKIDNKNASTTIFGNPHFPPFTRLLQCNPQDKATLLQIKSHFGGAGLLRDWDPTTDCCSDWPFIGCTSDYDPNPDRVNAVTVSGGTGLKGNIPDVLGNLPFLDNIMFFDEPKLTGPIPQSLSKLTKLRVITLNSNGLSGPIPSFLGNLKSLSQVDISGNKFTGAFPASFGTLPALTQLNVSHNMITGSIPNLSKTLTSLDVSFNQLCGQIPAGLSKFGASMFQHNKCLCGAPLAACK